MVLPDPRKPVRIVMGIGGCIVMLWLRGGLAGSDDGRLNGLKFFSMLWMNAMNNWFVR